MGGASGAANADGICLLLQHSRISVAVIVSSALRNRICSPLLVFRTGGNAARTIVSVADEVRDALASISSVRGSPLNRCPCGLVKGMPKGHFGIPVRVSAPVQQKMIKTRHYKRQNICNLSRSRLGKAFFTD